MKQSSDLFKKVKYLLGLLLSSILKMRRKPFMLWQRTTKTFRLTALKHSSHTCLQVRVQVQNSLVVDRLIVFLEMFDKNFESPIVGSVVDGVHLELLVDHQPAADDRRIEFWKVGNEKEIIK